MLTKRVGQRVFIEGGRFYGPAQIVKVNPKNIKIKMDDGRQVSADPIFLRDLDGAVPAAVETVEYRPPLSMGAVVQVRGVDGLCVVLTDRVDTVKLARLGGDPTGRYWPNVPRSLVTEVKIEATVV